MSVGKHISIFYVCICIVENHLWEHQIITDEENAIRYVIPKIEEFVCLSNETFIICIMFVLVVYVFIGEDTKPDLKYSLEEWE